MNLPKNCKDISGRTFGLLTAVRYTRSNNGAFWLFRCECGRCKELRASIVSGGHQKSCGCLSEGNRFKGEALAEGDVINGITAVRMAGKSGHDSKWQFRCFCGVDFVAYSSNVMRGNTKSCGCLKKKVLAEKARKHGMSSTGTYSVWHNMLRRCRDKDNPAYKNYGGRGIDVCDRWLDFEKFLLDMGEKPKDRSLERRDNNKGYSKDNCYWATWIQQSNNKRANVTLTIDGETRTITQWCEIKQIPSSRVFARRKNGWREDELFLPKRPKRKQ